MGAACLQSLYFPELTERERTIDKANQGTCEWIMNHELFKRWRQTGCGLLWISGKPGAGKSTLLRHVLREILKKDNKTTMSFFCHGRGSELQKSELGLFRSLCHQLLSRFPEGGVELIETYERGKDYNRRYTWTVQELKSLLIATILAVLQWSPIRVFIDALDEFGAEPASELIRYFRELDHSSQECPHPFSLCFSCRHYPVLHPKSFVEICVENHNGEDIERYLQQELLGPVDNIEEGEILKKEVQVRSMGVFQWVALVVRRLLNSHAGGDTLRQLRRKLQEIPQDLDDLYTTILEELKAKDGPRSLKLFQWLCFAYKPLSVSELQWAMNIDADPTYKSLAQWEDSEDHIETEKQMTMQLQNLSGGLAEWATDTPKNESSLNSKAQLIHQSVLDYMVYKGLEHLSGGHGDDETQARLKAHQRLSRSCLVYALASEIKDKAEQVFVTERWPFMSYRNRRKVFHEHFPLLCYALEYSVKHAQAVEIASNPLDQFLDYFGNAVNWQEVLCHLSRLEENLSAVGFEIPSAGTLLHLAVANGLHTLLREILAQADVSKELINVTDMYGYTPLIYAAWCGDVEAIRLLLAEGQPHINVNTKDKNGRSALIYSCQSSDTLGTKSLKEEERLAIATLLLESGASINHMEPAYNSVLFCAVHNGFRMMVELLLLQEPMEFWRPTLSDGSLVSTAMKDRYFGIAKLLVEHTAEDMDIRDNKGNTPLHQVVRFGYLEPSKRRNSGNMYLEAVYEWFASARMTSLINSGNSAGETPLHLAAMAFPMRGVNSLLDLLLARTDVNLNVKDNSGRTPLWWAKARGASKTVKLLLAKDGIDASCVDLRGQTPIFEALHTSTDALMWLLEEKNDINIVMERTERSRG